MLRRWAVVLVTPDHLDAVHVRACWTERHALRVRVRLERRANVVRDAGWWYEARRRGDLRSFDQVLDDDIEEVLSGRR